MPRRIQRRRVRGWRMPEGAVYVGRGSKWGNPYRVGARGFLAGEPFEVLDRAHAVFLFRTLVAPRIDRSALAELAGRDLACWCPLDSPCHADILLRLANQGGL